MICTQGECNGYDYICLQSSPLHGVLSSGYWPPEDSALTVIKQNPKVSSGFLAAVNGSRLYFKGFPMPGWSGALKRWTGWNRAMNNWTVSWRLWHQKISAPRPHALITGAHFAWYICAAVEETVTLQEVIQGAAADCETKSMLCERATKELIRLHEAGVVHGDFKWGNLLVKKDRGIVITDLDSARCRRFVGPAAAAKDLARFLVNGLEHGLNQGWALSIIGRYAAERRMSAEEMTARLQPLIARVSRAHQQKYGRKRVYLELKKIS